MRAYHERLHLPVSWWVLGMIMAVTLATFIWAGFSLLVAVASYVIIVGGLAAIMLMMGMTTVEVGGGELRAGRQRLPLSAAGEVAALDADQARALRGPRADPAAMMLFRPYLPSGVYIQVVGGAGNPPYWLVGSRTPDALAAAIEQARPPAHQQHTAQPEDRAHPEDTAVG